MEHSLATKKQHISKRESTITEVSVSGAAEAADSSTCADWRRNCRLKGEQIAWEPPVRALKTYTCIKVNRYYGNYAGVEESLKPDVQYSLLS